MLEKLSETVPKWEVMKHVEITKFINDIIGTGDAGVKLTKGRSLLPSFVI